MPTKTKEQQEAVEQAIQATNPEADIHHMIRRIGQSYHQDGTIPVGDADAQVRTWLQAGYKLAHVQSLGLEPNGVNILYILIKD
jgi:hypothetical protein